MVQDSVALCRLIVAAGSRDGLTPGLLEGRGFTQKKIEAILAARERSKGGEIAEEDLARVKALSSLTVELCGERDKLSEYVENSMQKIAPNVYEVTGATIGARLMAKAGGLERLAMLPASTIQILGAEKALFRALRSGARPPKHGILFQHEAVHSAPKWQRGKIARTIANKVAIAARVDCYRGSEEVSIKESLDKRLESIREKYKEPPNLPERRDHPRRLKRFLRPRKSSRR
jgi:nucleolar protein 56